MSVELKLKFDIESRLMLLIVHGMCSLKMWGKQDLNPRATDYASVIFPYSSVDDICLQH